MTIKEEIEWSYGTIIYVFSKAQMKDWSSSLLFFQRIFVGVVQIKSMLFRCLNVDLDNNE